ncbi:MAG: phosphotransferase family protein [Acidimicrobiales bacterium]
MGVASEIPGPADVDSEFLTGVLGLNGIGSTVTGFTAEPVGTGQIGQCIRYQLELANDDESCPKTLVGKFASDDETSRATGVALRNYVREVRFYQEIQDRVSIRTPRCYHAAIEGDGPDFVLILEDLAPAVQGDQLRGCSPTVAEAAIGEAIGLHAPTWNDASFDELDWLAPRVDPAAPTRSDLYGQLLAPFFDRFRSRLEADEAAIIEKVATSTGAPWNVDDDPTSLVHVDYRLDNILIDDRSDPPTVTVVDWQSVTIGNPLVDVAYFLGAGLQPEVRRETDDGIVRSYHRGLVEAGVADYSWDRCWADYRRASFHGFVITVIASTIVVETERGNDMFTAMAKRHARHALDLGAEEFLT